MWLDIREALQKAARRIRQNKLLDAATLTLLDEIPVLGGFASKYWASLKLDDSEKADQLATLLESAAKQEERFEALKSLIQMQGPQLLGIETSTAEILRQVTEISSEIAELKKAPASAAIIREYEKTQRKRWRELDELIYPAYEDDKECRGGYFNQICAYLHRSFGQRGYQDFVNLWQVGELDIEGEAVPSYSLLGHQANFTGTARESWKYLWNPEIPKEKRQKFQDDLHTEITDLHQTWSLSIRLPLTNDLTAVRFVYDPDGRRISIGPPSVVSTSPGDYADKVHNTSELFCFLAAMIDQPVVFLGNLAWASSHYPLYKTVVDILDHGHISLERVRVNVDDPEDWDYINVKVDDEVRAYSAR